MREFFQIHWTAHLKAVASSSCHSASLSGIVGTVPNPVVLPKLQVDGVLIDIRSEKARQLSFGGTGRSRTASRRNERRLEFSVETDTPELLFSIVGRDAFSCSSTVFSYRAT